MASSLLDYEWACPNCTYMNKPGSFKCKVCLGPKGTATREVKTGVPQDQQYVTESYQSQVKLHKAAIAKSLQTAAISKTNSPVTPSLSSSSSSSSSTTTASSAASVTVTSTNTTPSSASTTSSGSGSGGGGGTPVSSKKRCRSKAASSASASSKLNKWPRLSNLNRSVSFKKYITFNSVQVLITEYDVF